MDWKALLKNIVAILPYDKIVEFVWGLLKEWLENKVADSESEIDDKVFYYISMVIEELIQDLKKVEPPKVEGND